MRREAVAVGLAVAGLALAVTHTWRTPAPPQEDVSRVKGHVRSPTAEEEGGVLQPTQAAPRPAGANAAPRGSPRAPAVPEGPTNPPPPRRAASHLYRPSEAHTPAPRREPSNKPQPSGGAGGVETPERAPQAAPSSRAPGAQTAQSALPEVSGVAGQAADDREVPAGSESPVASSQELSPEPAGAGAAVVDPARKPALQVTPPKPVYAPAPEYPGFRLAVEPGGGSAGGLPVRPEGRLRVRLLVRADGTVGAVELLVSSGDPDLDRAAVTALSGWHFEPARRDGQPVDSYYVVWVAFRTVQP